MVNETAPASPTSSPLGNRSVLDLLNGQPWWQRNALRVVAVLSTCGLLGAICADLLHERPFRLEATPIPASELAFYRGIASDVRGGENYYAVANRRLRDANFPVNSFVRWRLPTLSWLAASLPSDGYVCGVLLIVGLAAWALALVACREADRLGRWIMAIGLAGIALWPLLGDAPFTHELWAGLLISISASLGGLGRHRLAPLAAAAALAFRELALPYCLCAAALEWWRGRRASGLLWLAVLAAGGAFYGWHAQQIRRFVAPDEWAQSDGLAPWLACGGLEFVLRTARMNALLILLPRTAAYVVLVLALLGLAAMRHETSRLLLAAVLAYVAAFCFVGQDFNGYWGLIYTPLLPVGLAHARGGLCAIGLWPGRQFAP